MILLPHTVPSDVLILYTEKIFKVLIWLMGHWDGVGGRGGGMKGEWLMSWHNVSRQSKEDD